LQFAVDRLRQRLAVPCFRGSHISPIIFEPQPRNR
jgi:hypothetical protein